ncbi:MAG TPA: CRISPR-associated endonuclease Cas1 [Clostridiaceae bacterium]|nr:CRISPR-associated endonuclease Cas1 [Clostridiaceae bacterium]
MGILYLTEPGTQLNYNGGRVIATLSGVEQIKLPLSHVEGVVVSTGVHLTEAVTAQFLDSAVPVTYISSRGKYFGHLETSKAVNIERQIKQFEWLRHPSFRLDLSRKVIDAKVRNSFVVVREFARHHPDVEVDSYGREIRMLRQRIAQTQNIAVLLGIEGHAAKLHFERLNQLIKPEFRFAGRTRHPPKDPFNSMLSYGYTLLLHDFNTALRVHGLHPYLGFLHEPRNGHPSLASDMMELWRPVLVDAFVVHLANRNTFHISDFETTSEGGVYLNKDASKTFVTRYEERVKRTKQGRGEATEFSYRLTIENQVRDLVRAIESEDPTQYQPYLLS